MCTKGNQPSSLRKATSRMSDICPPLFMSASFFTCVCQRRTYVRSYIRHLVLLIHDTCSPVLETYVRMLACISALCLPVFPLIWEICPRKEWVN